MINGILAIFLLMVGAVAVFVIGFLVLGALFKIVEFLIEKITNCFAKKETA